MKETISYEERTMHLFANGKRRTSKAKEKSKESVKIFRNVKPSVAGDK